MKRFYRPVAGLLASAVAVTAFLSQAQAQTDPSVSLEAMVEAAQATAASGGNLPTQQQATGLNGLSALPTPAAPQAPTASSVPALPSANNADFPDPNTLPAFNSLRAHNPKIYPMQREGGLIAWLAVLQDKFQVVYTTADGQYMLIGIMIDGAGDVRTAAHLANLRASGTVDLSSLQQGQSPSRAGINLQQQPAAAAPQTQQLPSVQLGASTNSAPAPSAQAQQQTAAASAAPQPQQKSPAEMLLSEFSEAPSILMGSSSVAPTLNIMVDPTCPFCKAYWKDLEPYVDSGKLQVRLIPVGALSQQSMTMAGALLSASNQAQSWRDLANQSTAGHAPANIGPADRHRLTQAQENTALMQRWSIPAVPYTVYRNRLGKVMVVTGQATDLPSLIEDVLGR